MESRARAILPIIAIVLVVLIALAAFMITRRIRNNSTTSPSPTPVEMSDDLLLPTPVGNTNATPRPNTTVVTQIPVTGPEDDVKEEFTTAVDTQGFRTAAITVKPHTQVNWINLGTSNQKFIMDGVTSEAITPNNQFVYVFTTPGTYTVTTENHQTQTVSVQ